ncbi:helix-turn-helix domain-containing protein [Rhodococcus aetherivorans]|uniref:helix-turn-helix domain-containing protein n=1 Tax=Rhodococcus aetherivorans TaxID=191292 RepID=UPI0021A6CED1|nr:helix-turn-helix transcriptional regulator [Rhodococcus aetherivorans]
MAVLKTALVALRRRCLLTNNPPVSCGAPGEITAWPPGRSVPLASELSVLIDRFPAHCGSLYHNTTVTYYRKCKSARQEGCKMDEFLAQNLSQQGGRLSRSTVRGFSGARLRRLREARGLTGDDLADAAGISEATLRSWEIGRANPTPSLLADVAKKLRVTIGDLLVLRSDELTLADLRTLAGLNQADVAQKLGVGTTTLTRIEKGRRDYDPEVARELARIYKVKVRELRTVWERTRQIRLDMLEKL